MSGLYGIGVSGLLTAQKQLQTTGHNIANANTEGFSRHRALQVTNAPWMSGGHHLGQGTHVNDVSRVFDKFAFKEQISASNRAAFFSARAEQLTQLDSNMSRGGAVVKGAAENYFDSLHSITDQPADESFRRLFLDQADLHAKQLGRMYDSLDQQYKSINGQIEQAAVHLTDLAADLAKVNEEILGTSGNLSPDLLDKRDNLVGKIAEMVNVSTLENPDGSVSLFMASGQSLVSETRAMTISVEPGDPDVRETQLLVSIGNSQINVDESLMGGQIGGLFETRDNELKSAKSELDLLAMAQADAVNQQQSEGLDLNGAQGGELYNSINNLQTMAGRLMADSGNTGATVGGVRIDDVSALTGDEYKLEFDGANFTLTNMTNGSSQVLAPSAPPANNEYVTADGFTLDLGAPPLANAGDAFLVRPTQNGVANFEVKMTDPRGVAASSAVDVRSGDNNVSTGKVSIGQVFDPVAARTNYNMPLKVEVFDNAGTFELRVFDQAGADITANIPGAAGGPPPFITYNPVNSPETFTIQDGGGNDLFEITVEGSPTGRGPHAPETFFIDDAFGSGNGNNALKLADIQNQKLVRGTYTLDSALAGATGRAGTAAASADTTLATAVAIHDQAVARQQSVSGVNLDEEASNMMRFQQAYQASSRILEVANTIFDTLLQSSR